MSSWFFISYWIYKVLQSPFKQQNVIFLKCFIFYNHGKKVQKGRQEKEKNLEMIQNWPSSHRVACCHRSKLEVQFVENIMEKKEEEICDMRKILIIAKNVGIAECVVENGIRNKKKFLQHSNMTRREVKSRNSHFLLLNWKNFCRH